MDDQASAAGTTLPPVATAPREARRFVTDMLDDGAPPDLVDVVELLTCEAVTNAVLHAGTDIDLRLVQAPERIRVEITDRSSLLPRPRLYDDQATTGRGLQLIESLACAWGVEPRQGSKVLWFEVCEG